MLLDFDWWHVWSVQGLQCKIICIKSACGISDSPLILCSMNLSLYSKFQVSQSDTDCFWKKWPIKFLLASQKSKTNFAQWRNSDTQEGKQFS